MLLQEYLEFDNDLYAESKHEETLNSFMVSHIDPQPKWTAHIKKKEHIPKPKIAIPGADIRFLFKSS